MNDRPRVTAATAAVLTLLVLTGGATATASVPTGPTDPATSTVSSEPTLTTDRTTDPTQTTEPIAPDLTTDPAGPADYHRPAAVPPLAPVPEPTPAGTDALLEDPVPTDPVPDPEPPADEAPRLPPNPDWDAPGDHSVVTPVPQPADPADPAGE